VQVALAAVARSNTMKTVHDTLLTPRLALRRLTPADLDLLSRLQSDPDVMRYAGGVKSRADTEAFLNERILDYYTRHPGLGVWATIERATGKCIGQHLLNHIRGESIVQVGYLLFPEYWGRGYATEMCTRLLNYGFSDLGIERIAAITDLPNVISQRVLLKAGLVRDGERTFEHYGTAPLAWFERDATSWLAERGSA
jgi:[ribosomal protein S5]-alanine N-acetyltransferase